MTISITHVSPRPFWLRRCWTCGGKMTKQGGAWYCPRCGYEMTDMTERKFYNDLDNDAAADWTPVASDLSDVDRAWTMAAHLCKMHRYHLQSYLGWGKAYGRGLVTEMS
jgi:hypothetical protein